MRCLFADRSESKAGAVARLIPPWHHARYRGLLIQAAVLAGVTAVAISLAYYVAASLEARGIRTGFGFLSDRGGFQISQALVRFGEDSNFGRAFVVGLLNTLLVGALAIPISTIIGVMVGSARLSSSSSVARLGGLYVETIRNIPLLIQLFFWYFVAMRALPPLRQSWMMWGVALNNRGLHLPVPATDDLALYVGAATIVAVAIAWFACRRRGAAAAVLLLAPVAAIAAAGALQGWDTPHLRGFNFVGGLLLSPELVALTVALAVYQAAYVAENVRAGILSVPQGQSEAARALGLGKSQTRRLVVMPQAMVAILPPLATTYVNTVKSSSIAAAIAYPDLVAVFAGTVLNLTGQALEIMLITGSVYLAISIAIAATVSLAESRLAWRRN